MLTTAIAAAVLLATSAQQYNLECTGPQEGGAVGLTPEINTITETYRIDLERMVWCVDDCKSGVAIKEANNASLLLQDVKVNGMEASIRINRTTGELSSSFTQGPPGRGQAYVRSVLQCRKLDYVPIPSAQF